MRISFYHSVIPKIDFTEYPITEDGINKLLLLAETELGKAKPHPSKRFVTVDSSVLKSIKLSIWKRCTASYNYLTNFLNRFKKAIAIILGTLTTLVLINEVLKAVFPGETYVVPVLTSLLGVALSVFTYYFDPRIIPVILLIFIISFRLLSRGQDNQQLLMALSERSSVADAMEKTKKSVPANHYLLYIHGRVGPLGLEVRQRLGPEIIDAINKNIKKHEHVYWSALNEIAMIIYEVNEKDEVFFLRVIKKKLITEIGNEDGIAFFNSLKFASTQVRDFDSLMDIEDRTRLKLSEGYGLKYGKKI